MAFRPGEKMAISLTPLAPSLGARVSGLDATDISPKQAQELYEAWLEHHVLVVPGPVISEDRLVNFARCLGDIENARRQSVLASRPEDMVISHIRANGKTVGALPDGALMFHSERI